MVGSTDAGEIYLLNRQGQVRSGNSGKLLTGFEGKLVGEDQRKVPKILGTFFETVECKITFRNTPEVRNTCI